MARAATNSADSATAPAGTADAAPRRLLVVIGLQAAVAGVDLVEDVEVLPDGRPDGVAAVDVLAVLADVVVEVREQLARYLDAYLGHIPDYRYQIYINWTSSLSRARWISSECESYNHPTTQNMSERANYELSSSKTFSRSIPYSVR